ncbi:MAG: SusC/RagA family TonB-linked outer membrane protein [Gemmatimonadetes bacterium]|nr:SusC/RagA family TonB-linked outer membrane protein [Gemmatimonadota bacterium]
MSSLSRLTTAALVTLALAFPRLAEPAVSVSRDAFRSLQEATVRGVVTDGRTGQPLEGAQVHFPRLALGTLTNAAGRYTLSRVPAGQHELQAEYLGYRTVTQTVAVTPGAGVVVDIELTASAIGLDEIVVTGTPGAVSRRELGVAVDQLAVDEVLETAPVLDFGQLLNNRSPGVVVLQAGGQIGTGSVPQIRGTKSLSLSGRPIVYVDGIRVDHTEITGFWGGQATPSRLNDINPDDIESIEIIKGPAASTIYGTEASNGVIQILTKQGRPGQTRMTVTSQQGANWFRNPQGRLPVSYYRQPDGTIITQDLYDEEKAAGRAPFSTGHLQSYGINVRGGTTSFGYFISGDYDDHQGITPTNWVKNFSARANVNGQLFDNLDLTSSMGFVTSDMAKTPEACSCNYGPYPNILWGSPSTRNKPLRGYLESPPEDAWTIDAGQDVDRFTWSIKAEYRLFPWLSQRMTLGTDVVHETNHQLYPRHALGSAHFFGSKSLGEKRVQNVERENRTLDYAATATFDLRQDLNAATSFGIQYYQRTISLTEALGQVFPAEGLESVAAGTVRFADEQFVENKTFGLFVQERLAWKDRVFLTLALRADDNSAFGESVDPVYYPKISGVWVISDEPFWSVPGVSELRLRGAWGMAGQQPDAFAAIRTYVPSFGPTGTPAILPRTPGNPNLEPEKGQELELGFDASVFADRLGIEFTYFNERTKDAIVEKNVAPSAGFSGTQFVNLGEVKNVGFELALNAVPVRVRRLSWDVTTTVAHYKNEIVSMGGLPPINTGAGRRTVWHQEGYPIGGFWDKRVVQAEKDASGKIVNVLCDGGPGKPPTDCATAPRIFIGGPGPYWDLVTTTGLSFGNLRLTALVDMKLDQRKINITQYGADYIFRNSARVVAREADPKYLASVERTIIGANVQRIDWVKLREIGARYTLPGALANRLFGASGIALSVTGRNLWDVWRHPEDSDVDSEVHSDTRAWVRQTQTVLPPVAIILTGISVTF